MHSHTAILLACTFVLIFAPTNGYAFGAGDVPDFSYLNDKAFRHGDIEGILETLAKSVGGAASGGGLLGLASSVLSAAKGGEKFGRLDIKRVYFGNWLRDYSQALDIAGLSQLSADTLVMVVSVLGFMTFGFATEEFEVTGDRLSVYLPVEHIDNPKGYSEKEGDARQFHPKLRPPVDPRELEIDERTGMKNYMATENEGWDTSTAHIRRTFEACIEHGRRAQGREGGDLWEAYRLLGTGLHTLEDLLAHSNWCEIALRKMGHSEVFCHVGDDVLVDTPNGRAAPLVTGTFGSADFIHSLMGEATDHISEASVTNLYDKMKQSGDADSSIEGLKSILSKLPIGGGSDKAEQAEDIKKKAFDFNPDNFAPKEVQEQLLQTLKWRDDVYRDIIKKIEMVPGLNDLIDELTNALNAYIYTVLAPWLTPIMQQVTGALGEGSKAVIDSDDQYEVFNNSNASDPSHSILSKDHFSLILNEPAGKIAKVVVENTVNLIVPAWFNDDDPGRVIDEILEAFHHPYYATGNSRIQNAMMDQMERWFGGLGESEGRETIQALTKESVREGKNHRLGDNDTSGASGAEPTSSHRPQTQSSGYGSQQSQGGYSSGGYGGYQGGAQSTTNTSSYQRRDDDGSRDDRYGRGGQSYGGRQNESEYSSGTQSHARRDDGESSNPQDSYGGGRQSQSGYESSSRRDDDSFGQRQEPYGGRQEGQEYGRGPGRSDDNYGDSGRFGGSANDSYGRASRPEVPAYESPNESYGRGDEGREGHGGHGGHGHDGPRHHRQEEFQSEGYQPSYDRPERGGDDFASGGYSGGERRGGYGGGDGDGGPRAAGGLGGFGGQPPRRDEGFGGDVGGNYDGGRGGGYGNDETFGAERLNLEDRGDGYGYGGGRRRSREDY